MKGSKSKPELMLSSALGLLVLSASALTQEQSRQSQIDEVIVVGQKIERTLKETKESVALITEQQIERRALLTLEDIYNQSANVYMIGNGEGFGIRGVSMGSTSTGTGTGELGSYYIDGVAFTGSFSKRFAPQALWDIQQVEVLRGPQSTNVGRSAMAGAVVMTTNAPNPEEFEARIRAGLGNASSRDFSGMVNIPLSDVSALRLSAEKLDTDGFISNPTLGTDDFDARDNTTLRAKWSYAPSDNFSALATIQYAETKRGQNIFWDGLSTLEDRNNFSNLEARENWEGYNASLDLRYQLNDSWAIRSITSYMDSDYDRFDDDDNTAAGGNAFRGRTGVDKNWAEELRFDYQSDNLNGVTGIYYTVVDVVNVTSGLAAINPGLAGVPVELLPFYPSVIEVAINSPFDSETTNYAFFTEWEWQFRDRWTLTLGARYDKEEKNNNAATANELLTALPDPVVSGQQADLFAPGTGPFVQAGVAQVNGFLLSQLEPISNRTSTDYTAFMPEAGITYDIDGNSYISLFVKRGYRAGDIELNLSGTISEYDPEFLTNYELAYRTSFGDGYSFYANAYFSDWTDQQVEFFIDGNLFNSVVLNSGESSLLGLELELTAKPHDNLEWWANLGYSSTEFDNFRNGDEDFSGNEFAGAPEITAAIGGTYWFSDSLYASASLNYQDEFFSDVQNTFEADTRTLANVRVTYLADTYQLSVFSTNLFDKTYVTSRNDNIAAAPLPGANLVRVGDPREIGVQLTIDF